MQSILPSYFIKIKLFQKNKGFKYKKEIFSHEYGYLLNLIEFDEAHKSRQIKNKENSRYDSILPYEDNIVKLLSSKNIINASWIHHPFRYYFIATQGPLPYTIEDFWTMCYENKVSVIVMLCNLIENKYEKCANYWEIKNLKNYEITVIKEEKKDGMIIRDFKLFNKEKNDIRNIKQFHLISWGDHAALKKCYSSQIIKLIELIDKNRGRRNAVVHCSAGIGRTGTFLCMYHLYHEIMSQIYQKNLNNEISFCIMNLVRKMKEMRMYSVENENQYEFLYIFADYLLKNYNVKK